MNTRHTVSMRSSLMCAALSLFAVGCQSGNNVECGPNTRLDEATNQCVLDLAPGLNIIVDDFKIGNFSLTSVDVPEQLQVGTPDTRTFTITNEGTDDRPVVLVRYAIAPVKATIQELRDQIDDMSDGSEIDATFLGLTIIKNLKVGESRQVEYFLNAPATVKDGLYGFMFSVDEVPLTESGTDEYAVDYAADGMANANNTARLGNAALVHAPATVIVGKPDRANLRVLYTKMDNSSFELDDTEGSKIAMFTMSARMSSQAFDLTEPVTATFELKLPGHSPKTPGQDLGASWFEAKGLDFESAPPTTEWVYDAERTFPLLFQQTEGLVASRTYESVCRTETVAPDAAAGPDAEPTEVEHCAVIVNEEGRDDVYRLYLRPEDTTLLGLTAGLTAFNPGLDANGEVQGQLVYRLVTAQLQYQDNVADDIATVPVVFMAPAADRSATGTDVDDGGVGEAANGTKGPYAYVIKDSLSESTSGNDWFGAGYRLENSASAEKRFDIVTAGYRSAGAKLWAMILKKQLDIIDIGGNLDWNQRNPIDQWEAGARLVVLGYNVLNVAFKPSFCKTTDMITYCPLFEAEPDSDPKAQSKKTDSGTAADKKEKGSEMSKEWKFYFMAGPIPLMIQAEIGFKVGVSIQGGFVIDQSDLVPKYGIQFGVGPFAKLYASVFGGISIGIARAGIEGNLTIIKVECMPTIRPVARLAHNGAGDCYKYANTTLTFEIPLTITGPEGNVQIVFYIGFKFCLWKCWKWEVKIFGITIASFHTFEKTWMLFTTTKEWSKAPGQEGMCTDAWAPPPTVTWSSPTSCSGNYCNNSSTGTYKNRSASLVLAAYKKTYDLAATAASCVDVTVKGTTEASSDPVVIYDEDGVPQNTEAYGKLTVPGWSGVIDNTLRVCSGKVTVALETNGSNTRAGVNVVFTPVQ